MKRVLAAAAFAIVGALSQAWAQSKPNDYSDPATWLCRPGLQDAKNACQVDLTATVVGSDGTASTERWQSNPNAPVDCFYVYPTVSRDVTPNSDMNPGPEERSVVHQQLARFGSQCRIFAPLYRQVTLAGLQAFLAGKPMAAENELGYNDVLAAWKYYLAHDNQGRGVVLIGHSQGSLVLTQLIANEIDGKPAQRRMISALLLGWNVAVPKDQNVGGDFKQIPVCGAATQIQCVLAYASFRASSPPPANSLFGRVPNANHRAICVNPAALVHGSNELHSYLNAARRNGPWTSSGAAVTTPFVSVPGLLSAQCVTDERGTYLSVTVHANAADPRADEIEGDVVANGIAQTNWGLHLIDANLTMGDLVTLVGMQAKAYTTAYEAAMKDCDCKNRE